MEGIRTQSQVLAELNLCAHPDSPFLSLGQTVFWDEPLKGAVSDHIRRLGFGRNLLSAVHDTDYFAKLPGHPLGTDDDFRAFPHNDTTTRDLWSAAGEFSSLFGSETVITREFLKMHGVNLGKIMRSRPGFLDQATEAFGWQGVVSLGEQQRVTAETPLQFLKPVLCSTFRTSLEQSLECSTGCCRAEASKRAKVLHDMVCDRGTSEQSLADYYAEILPEFHAAIGTGPGITYSRTTELLRFNRESAVLPRFSLVDFFLSHPQARTCYDEVVRGTEVYPLGRFGSWAIPFELMIPGEGRGTIRIAPKAVVIMTPRPQFVSTKTPVRNVAELAEAIERKFGPNCTLIGKAITLIGMLATEFVFMFHESASGYVQHSRRLHTALGALGWKEHLNPILRVKYETLSRLGDIDAWIKLPAPLARTFGVEELCSSSFAARLPEVVAAQQDLLKVIAQKRSSMEFIRYLAEQGIGRWGALEASYATASQTLQHLHSEIKRLRARRRELTETISALREQRNDLEHARGDHWRERIFEKSPTSADWDQRTAFEHQLKEIIHAIHEARKDWRSLLDEQEALVASQSVKEAQVTYRNIELEAEIKRVGMIRDAKIVTKGLRQAGLRPSAWWFPLVSPSGKWLQRTMETAEYHLEPLQ